MSKKKFRFWRDLGRLTVIPKIFAHRTGVPENSLRGLYCCLKNGAYQIECDITFTKDKKPVVWHPAKEDLINYCLRRPNIFVPDLTLKEVLALPRKDYPGEKILTLQNVLYFLSIFPKAKISFDVKYYFFHELEGHLRTIGDDIIELAIKELVEPACEIGLENQIGFNTFLGGAKLLKAVKNRCPSIATSFIMIFPWTRLENHYPYLDEVIIGQNDLNKWMWKIMPGRIQRLIEEIKKRNIGVSGGCANTEADVRRFLKYGVDGIWTDNIPLVRKILSQP